MRPPPLPKFKCRVLIVDDVEDNREMYAMYLEHSGVRIAEAAKRTKQHQACLKLAADNPSIICR